MKTSNARIFGSTLGRLILGVVLSSAPTLTSGAFAATAEIKNAKGEVVGHATFTEGKGGVQVAVEVKNLPKGPHGVHIHDTGKCEGPDFKTAGKHFNPDSKQHGLLNPKGPHAGDLPELTVTDEKKETKMQMRDDRVTLNPDKPNSLFHAGGTAIVIHSTTDDQKSDPAGNSGDRIACGVITK